MIAIDEAIAIIEQAVPPPRLEEVPLAEAAGRVLAEAVQALEPSPRYDNSAMDGYAVRYDDVAGCTRQRPAALRLVGESQAGIPFDGRLGAGEAVRISTGAVVPAGADTVAPVEETEEEGGAVRILACSQRGQHVRFQGEEFEAGAELLPVGTRLAAPQLALLASVGIGRVQVFRRPRIGLLVTGTELVAPPGTEIAGYQIRDTNTLMLTTAVTAAGGAVVACHRVGDDRAATAAAVASAAAEADIVLSTGGVSVGRHDHLREAVLAARLAEAGQAFVVRLPGRPVAVRAPGQPGIGLHVLRPLRAAGHRHPGRPARRPAHRDGSGRRGHREPGPAADPHAGPVVALRSRGSPDRSARTARLTHVDLADRGRRLRSSPAGPAHRRRRTSPGVCLVSRQRRRKPSWVMGCFFGVT